MPTVHRLSPWTLLLRRAALWLLLVLGGGLLPAHAAYYTATANAATAAAYPWIDISSSGTSISLGDDAVSTTYNLGFNFNFGGSNRSSVRVMSNGMLLFGGDTTAHINSALPLTGNNGTVNLDAAMMPLWDDLVPGSGQVRYKLQGAAPNRIFVVSWNNVPYFGGSYTECTSYLLLICLNYTTIKPTATFQVQIHEQGQFVYRYGTVEGNGGTHDSNGSFSNPNGAAIGVEVNNSDYVQFSRHSASVPSGTTILWSRPVTLLAEYLFNESAWTGSSAEVRDTGSSAYHASAAGLGSPAPTTVLVTPATGSTSSGTCSYGAFTRNNKDHVALPSSFPNLGMSSGFTVTAWIRTTDNSLPGQRIVIDDVNNNGGYGLSLGDGGAGTLRLLTRNLSNTSVDTPNVIANNTWYFVAFSIDLTARTKTIYVYNTSGTKLAETSASFTQTALVADTGIVTIGGEANGNSESNASYGFSGNIDEVRMYSGAMTTTELAAVRVLSNACAARNPATPLAAYSFEEDAWSGTAGELTDTAGASGGPYNGSATGTPLPSPTLTSPARTGNTGTCGYATLPGPTAGGGAFVLPTLPLSSHHEAQTSVSFWMYWNGTDNIIVASFDAYDLHISGGHFGFNTNNADIYGISSSGLANGWHHVAAVFTAGNLSGNKLWIDGVAQTLTQRMGTPVLSRATFGQPTRLGGYGPSTGFRFMGRLDELRIYSGAISATQVSSDHTATHLCPITLPGKFNVFETSTLTGAVTGKLKTKVAGTPFSVALVAVNTLTNVVLGNFQGLVKVELLDASDNSGALNDTSSCRSSWTPLAGATASNTTFSLLNLGRLTNSLTHPNAARNVRIRVSFPATGTATAVGCSTDNFAIRPASLGALAISHANWDSAGTTESLLSSALSGGAVHKAGRPFTVQATALNALGAITSAYDGTPTASATACAVTPTNACTSTLGALTLAAGSSNNGLFRSDAASYSEVGAFTLQLLDSSFAAVDASDGSDLAERTVSSAVLTVGRFVPDHFEISSAVDPVLQTFGNGTCPSRAFTYLGQPFGYATAPSAQLRAVNAAGQTVTNYTGKLWKLNAITATWSLLGAPATTLTPSTSAPTLLPLAALPGTGTITAALSDNFTLNRPSAAPVAPFDAQLALTWLAQDSSEAAGTLTTPLPLVFSPVQFDAGALFRYGRLRVLPAVGSELSTLPVPVAAEYWDGSRWLAHTADSCTSVPANAIAQANHRRQLGMCHTATASPNPLTLRNGRAFITLAKPGAGHAGSLDLSLQLGSSPAGQHCSAVGATAAPAVAAGLTWLQGKWQAAAAYTANPIARISFGQVRSPVIYLQEMY